MLHDAKHSSLCPYQQSFEKLFCFLFKILLLQHTIPFLQADFWQNISRKISFSSGRWRSCFCGRLLHTVSGDWPWGDPSFIFRVLQRPPEEAVGCEDPSTGNCVTIPSQESYIGVWQLPEGTRIHTLTGHNGGVTGISLQGNLAATSSYDSMVRCS